MCDAESRHLFCQDGTSSFQRLSLGSGLYEPSGVFDPFPQDQLMHLAHGCIWTGTDRDLQFGLY
jgi:hypothetical protein